MLKESIETKKDFRIELENLLVEFSRENIGSNSIVEALWQDPEEDELDVETYDKPFIVNKQLAAMVRLRKAVDDLVEKVENQDKDDNPSGSTLQDAIDVLKDWKVWLNDKDGVSVEMERGYDEKGWAITGARKYEPNRTRTMTIKINGGARERRL